MIRSDLPEYIIDLGVLNRHQQVVLITVRINETQRNTIISYQTVATRRTQILITSSHATFHRLNQTTPLPRSAFTIGQWPTIPPVGQRADHIIVGQYHYISIST